MWQNCHGKLQCCKAAMQRLPYGNPNEDTAIFMANSSTLYIC